MTAKGQTITFSVEGVGSVSAIDCTWQSNGDPGIVALSTAGFSVDELTVTDDNWEKLEVRGDIGGTASISSSVDSRLCKGYLQGVLQNTCNDCTPPECPGDEPFGMDCNGPCTSICKFIEGGYTVNSADYPNGNCEPHNVPGGWNPPNENGQCDEESCAPPAPPCGDCPPPYESYQWNFGGDCGDGQDPNDNTSVWIGGLTAWTWVNVVCP